MEEVVVVKEEQFKDGGLEQISFSKLEYVELCYLLSFKRFSSADCIEFPSLKELKCSDLGISEYEEEVKERELVATQPLFTEKVNSF